LDIKYVISIFVNLSTKFLNKFTPSKSQSQFYFSTILLKPTFPLLLIINLLQRKGKHNGRGSEEVERKKEGERESTIIMLKTLHQIDILMNKHGRSLPI